MTPPPTHQPTTTAPETPVSGAVVVSEIDRFIQTLTRVLYTEPGWERPLAQERLCDLLALTQRDFQQAGPC